MHGFYRPWKSFWLGGNLSSYESTSETRVEETYVKVLEDIYKESNATIKLHKVSEKISVKKRVRQGDTISPELFIVVSESFILRIWGGKKQELRSIENIWRFLDLLMIINVFIYRRTTAAQHRKPEGKSKNEKEENKGDVK